MALSRRTAAAVLATQVGGPAGTFLAVGNPVQLQQLTGQSQTAFLSDPQQNSVTLEVSNREELPEMGRVMKCGLCLLPANVSSNST